MSKIKIVFDPKLELKFGWRGMTDELSDTSPDCLDEPQIVLRNCTTHTGISKELNAALSDAADESAKALRSLIVEHFEPVGRAKESWNSEIEPVELDY